jgi:acylphosphatase
MRAVLVQVRGRVQGVGYRAGCHRAAVAQQLTGWVRNRQDGSVEALAQGSDAQLERWLTWCRRGSAAASVESVDVQEHPVDAALTQFVVAPTV